MSILLHLALAQQRSKPCGRASVTNQHWSFLRAEELAIMFPSFQHLGLLNPKTSAKPALARNPGNYHMKSPAQLQLAKNAPSLTGLERTPYIFHHVSSFVMGYITLKSSHPSHALPASGLLFFSLINRTPEEHP